MALLLCGNTDNGINNYVITYLALNILRRTGCPRIVSIGNIELLKGKHLFYEILYNNIRIANENQDPSHNLRQANTKYPELRENIKENIVSVIRPQSS